MNARPGPRSHAVVAGLLIAGALSFLAAGISAAQTGGVTVTVNPILPDTVAITVEDGSIAFGGVNLGETTDTTGSAETQTITNTGTVSIDLAVQYVPVGSGVGFDCGIDPPDWTPVETLPVDPETDPLIDEFRMRGTIDGGTSWVVFSATGLAAALPNASPQLEDTDDTAPLDYELRMPDEISTGGAGCSISTTVLATQSGS